MSKTVYFHLSFSPLFFGIGLAIKMALSRFTFQSPWNFAEGFYLVVMSDLFLAIDNSI
jgi:hypothetical protein